MSEVPNNWSREDFLALVLHYASQADLNISENEEKFIRRLCGESHYIKAAEFAKDRSDYDIIQTISEVKEEFFSGEKGSEDLKRCLTVLFKADDEYSYLEKNVMRGLLRVWEN